MNESRVCGKRAAEKGKAGKYTGSKRMEAGR